MAGYQSFRVGLHALIQRNDGKVLFLKRAATKSFLPGYYCLPCGHHDGDETIETGMARELKEEVGLIVDPADIELVGVGHNKTPQDLLEAFNFMFVIKKWQGEPQNMEPENADGIMWLDLADLPNPYVQWQIEMAREVKLGSVYYSNKYMLAK